MPLTTDQQAELRELVTPAAWTFYDALPADQKINLDVRLRMVGGDLNRLAAAVLRVACQAANAAAASSSTGNVKRFKVEGEYEEEYFAATTVDSSNAATWCAEATRLEAVSVGSGVPSPVLTEWGAYDP